MFSLVSLNALCSNSYSYQMNYRFQTSLYNKLDEKTDGVQWLRLPVFLAFNVSACVTVATRTAGIAETFFKGCGMLLLSPFASTPKDYAKKGLEELVIHTSKNMMRLAHFPFEYFFDSLILFVEPKLFIMEVLESFQLNLKHSITRTLGSAEYDKDFRALNGIAYANFLAYQRRDYYHLMTK